MPEFDLDHIFTYHQPDDDQIPKYNAIRTAAKQFARVIIDNSPTCPDQSVAIRKIREAVMDANAAIALNGRIHALSPLQGSTTGSSSEPK